MTQLALPPRPMREVVAPRGCLVREQRAVDPAFGWLLLARLVRCPKHEPRGRGDA